MATLTELGIPYLWPCASHHNANLPSSTARSKSATSRLSWSSASEIARVTTRRGNATFAASAHAVRAPAITVYLPASLGPTISTKRAGPMRFVGLSEERSESSCEAISATPHAAHSSCRPDGHEWDRRICGPRFRPDPSSRQRPLVSCSRCEWLREDYILRLPRVDARPLLS